MRKGSITIFSLLSMLLIAATLLALLEGTRALEINRLAKQQTESALESVFANYSTHLWETYRILGNNQQVMEEILIQRANGKYDEDEVGLNTMIFQVEQMDIQSYTLLTDGNGEAYVAAVSGYMEDNILYETAQNIYSQYEAIRSLQESSQFDFSAITDVIEGFEDSLENRSATGSIERNTIEINEITSLLEGLDNLLSTGILELVIEDTSGLSDTTMNLDTVVSTRELEEGRNPIIEEADWLDKILLQQYFVSYMSNYCDVKEGHYMDYELEYMVGRESSDIENLKAVVSKLLLIRTAANFLYLSTDSTKLETIGLVATALVGITGNALLLETVKIALMTAWAYGESILDVRALLEGKKIALLKSQDTWTLEWENIGTLTEEYAVARESQWGLSYESYVGLLLLFTNENQLAMYAMDVQEETLQHSFEEVDFRMDQLIVNATVEITYSYHPIFLVFGERFFTNSLSYEVSTLESYDYN